MNPVAEGVEVHILAEGEGVHTLAEGVEDHTPAEGQIQLEVDLADILVLVHRHILQVDKVLGSC